MSKRSPELIRQEVVGRVEREWDIVNRFLNPDDYPWLYDSSQIDDEVEEQLSPRDPFEWDELDCDEDGREAVGGDADY